MIRGRLRHTEPYRIYPAGFVARVGAAAVLGAAAALAWATSSPAQDGGCEGVTVVVDAGDGEPAVGCADDPATGIEALEQAGFSVVEVSAFPGAVCRIDEHPEADCGPMPPADASWSYWLADEADAEWTYASVGALMHDPDDGDVEGWTFGDGSRPPGITPAEAAGDPGATEPEAEDEAAEDDSGSNLTWIVAVAILAVIVGLIVWRRRSTGRGGAAA